MSTVSSKQRVNPIGKVREARLQATKSKDFPKYLLKVDGQRKFYTFAEAYVLYDSGMVKVEFGRYVLYEDFTVRKMDESDKSAISKAADKYSESK